MNGCLSFEFPIFVFLKLLTNIANLRMLASRSRLHAPAPRRWLMHASLTNDHWVVIDRNLPRPAEQP
jgi:hypothetical protein